MPAVVGYTAGDTHLGPPHSTAEALTTGSGWNPTGSTLRVFLSTASRIAEPSYKNTNVSMFTNDIFVFIFPYKDPEATG